MPQLRVLPPHIKAEKNKDENFNFVILLFSFYIYIERKKGGYMYIHHIMLNKTGLLLYPSLHCNI